MARLPDELRTPRLHLRAWSGEFDSAMAEISREPEVMRAVWRPGYEEVLAAFSGRASAHWTEHGFGLYEVFETADGGASFRGFAGMAYPTFVPELAHRPELGWRLAPAAWGRGLATEAAAVIRDVAFQQLALRELISIIGCDNDRSARVAEKLGMSIEGSARVPGDDREVDVWRVGSPAIPTA